MPDIITHYLFGLDTSKHIQSSPLYPIIKTYRSLFFLGLQGPDPMYYHDAYKKNNFHYVGKLMHQEKTGDFLTNCLTFAKQNVETPEIYDPLMSYISGLICHYVLDSMTHPYIFYLSGRYIEDIPESHVFKGLHKKIEVAIDALLLKSKFGLDAHKFKIHQHVLKLGKVPPCLINLYDTVLFNVYAIQNGGSIFEASYKSFKKYYGLTYDPIGIKKGIASTVSSLLPGDLSSYADSFSYYQCDDEITDYLNLNKAVWLHPITGTVYTFSFMDLLHNALKISSKLLLASYAYTQNTMSLDDFTAIMPDVSYLTGLPWQDTRPMTNFKPIDI
ncbi:MAG: hypothetical protein ACRCTE_09150 [Cellulosilyticaceae bacterium]